MQAHGRRVAQAAALAIALASGCASAPREDWQQPDEVIALLGIGPGDRVADLGAGDGYCTFRIADAVGDTGRVYAVDVDDDRIAALADAARARGAANVTVVRGEPGDPHLPDGELDLVFVCDTYQELADRVEYFRRLLVDLAPNGRVAIVDATAADEIARELREAGYEPRAQYDFLSRQSFSIFRADDGTGE